MSLLDIERAFLYFMIKGYEHIFFDLDRTLWHFDENSKSVLEDIYQNFELYKFIDDSFNFIKKYNEIHEGLFKLGNKYRETQEILRLNSFLKTLNYFNVDDLQMSKEIGIYYTSNFPKQKVLFPYATDLLDYLSDKYKIHLISNGFGEEQMKKIKESKLLKYFNTLTFSEHAGVKKPHPYIFKKAFAQAGSNSVNSIIIGDSLYADIYGAQRVKMKGIYFNSNKLPHSNIGVKEIYCLSELFTIL